MIEIRGVSKHFGDVEALASLSAEIKDGQVFGLVGTNGSGKSTLLRLIAGILKADEGAIGIDGEAVYENPAVKRQICLLPEEGAFLVSDTPNAAADRFAVLYPAFDRPRFDALWVAANICLRRSRRFIFTSPSGWCSVFFPFLREYSLPSTAISR